MWPMCTRDCTSCPNGEYQDEAGATECKTCDAVAGSNEISGSLGCNPCPSGTYKDDSSGACSECDPGSFGTGASARACTQFSRSCFDRSCFDGVLVCVRVPSVQRIDEPTAAAAQDALLAKLVQPLTLLKERAPDDLLKARDAGGRRHDGGVEPVRPRLALIPI